jgi:outer membrane protein
LAEGKIGYIDIQRVLDSSELAKLARADVDNLRQKKERIIQKNIQEIETIRNELRKRESVLGDSTLRRERYELEELEKQHQRLVAASRYQVEKEERELIAMILRRTGMVLKDVARREGYALVLKSPDAVGYVNPEYDITDQVIGQLEK